MTYTVQPGDTLSEIAERFGMTLGEISQLTGNEKDKKKRG